MNPALRMATVCLILCAGCKPWGPQFKPVNHKQHIDAMDFDKPLPGMDQVGRWFEYTDPNSGKHGMMVEFAKKNWTCRMTSQEPQDNPRAVTFTCLLYELNNTEQP